MTMRDEVEKDLWWSEREISDEERAVLEDRQAEKEWEEWWELRLAEQQYELEEWDTEDFHD
jgi:hypothetical protein